MYQKVLVLDLDYALYKKVEQDLWNVGFKQQIEALQAISKDRKVCILFACYLINISILVFGIYFVTIFKVFNGEHEHKQWLFFLL